MSKARELAELGAAYDSGALSNRNLIINGAMQVAQRGTSFTGSGEYTLDRFYQLESGGTATTTQETFALGSELEGFTKYLKQAVTTGNDYCGIIYKVEDVKSLPQGKATLSFYAKGTNPAGGSFQVVIYRMHDGSTTHDTLLNTTVTLTSSWQRFTNTFDVGSLSGMTTPTANSLIYIAIRQSQSDSGTAAWELNLTGMQLEVGTEATPFEHRSYGDELLRCQRYYYSEYISSQNGNIVLVQDRTSSSYYGTLFFPVEMRTGATVTSTGVDRLHKPAVRYDTIATGPSYYQANVNSVYIYAVATTADSASTMAVLGAVSGGTIQADAEL